MRRTRGPLVLGLLAVVVYLAAAALTYRVELVPGRPLYDGEVPPPPYNWVEPPSDLEAENAAPQPGEATVEFAPEGSRARTIATGDGQAFLILPIGGIEPREGEETVTVRITPVAARPRTFDGMLIDGNAYRYDARYTTSGEPVRLLANATVILRYPVHATQIVRSAGGRWEDAGATQAAVQSAQLFVRVRELGTFAAAGAEPPREIPLWVYLAAGSAVALAVAAGYEWRRSRARAAARASGKPVRPDAAKRRPKKRRR
ncbi:MAG TPA: hypothetical protein VM840_10335 [Actinomycetota bacterium]|nr:hypothetical protein [Actinomycetota bacterium]